MTHICFGLVFFQRGLNVEKHYHTENDMFLIHHTYKE